MVRKRRYSIPRPSYASYLCLVRRPEPCVMASGHMTHLTWCFSGGWEEALMDPDIDQAEAKLGRGSASP